MTFMEEELKTFVESEVTVYIATRDAELQPEAGFAWAPRMISDNELEVFVDREASAKMVANLRENRQVAVTLSSPITYRSIQLKGWCAEIREPASDDAPWVDRHRTMVTEALRARGLPAHVSRTYWSRDVVRLRCMIETKYDQTPGPGAGAKL
jgi:predicted pyridoxine 5'-phosphate oxidase superfamily flavin-nucleotide-binding protein